MSKNNTRKKEPKSTKIEFKSELKKQKQKTLRKNVLKMIREKQQEAYKNLFDTKKTPTTPSTSSNVTDEFDKDFDESLKFFSSLANKVESEKASTPLNTTFKNRLEPQFIPGLASAIAPAIAPVLTNSLGPSIPLSNFIPTIDNSNPAFKILPQPQYGCLKNGSLPTFRSFTRKNGGDVSTQVNNNSSFQQSLLDTPLLSQEPFPPNRTSAESIFTPKFIEQSQKFDKIQQGNLKNKPKQRIKYKKLKKIFKRTYKVGRSKTEPTIGVLVSNKTVRSRISTQAQLLKQTPILDVRKFLIKKGFIKVGTNAPNDVLRKMYETVSLVCGEIQNHNPENLLYNFVNDRD
jgi:hypothetical protein